MKIFHFITESFSGRLFNYSKLKDDKAPSTKTQRKQPPPTGRATPVVAVTGKQQSNAQHVKYDASPTLRYVLQIFI